MKNAFNEMEEASSRSFQGSPVDRKIRRRINSSLGTMRFLGQIADVYVNRLVDTVVGMASGGDGEPKNMLSLPEEGKNKKNSDSIDPKYPNL